ncbi:MAG: hypothetical protein ABT15_11865 [Pseudonocardia sp. SCN 73-27]|uniref:phage holin family protein n=1 Tax=unclassified Pseudonocardia TaxID=2619320 RepID=UPI00086BDD7F|nr:MULTISPECIES: phage holin family protein [unclassified Pseudonocardia]ODU27009.1 MAG: hypothetical protein ABS80_05380 [Pseudonocardia sp. SCN 72-51]ODV06524.1 MAG: hypothetical protein ABT15_11865 [Pseudonocardia sp. SCN 73-27]
MTSHSETSVSSVSAPPQELSTADLLRRVSDQVRDLVRDEAALARDELSWPRRSTSWVAGPRRRSCSAPPGSGRSAGRYRQVAAWPRCWS